MRRMARYRIPGEATLRKDSIRDRLCRDSERRAHRSSSRMGPQMKPTVRLHATGRSVAKFCDEFQRARLLRLTRARRGEAEGSEGRTFAYSLTFQGEGYLWSAFLADHMLAAGGSICPSNMQRGDH